MQNIKYITYLVFFVIASLLASCSHDGLESLAPEVPDMGEHTNLTLVLNVNSDPYLSTRASDNPMGGENGNGLRQGEHHENDVKNISVFAFAGVDNKGVADLADETPVKYCRYVNDVNFMPTYANSYYQDTISTEVNIQFEGKIVSSSDAFLVVANMGDLTESVTTLKDIRDLVVAKTLTRPALGEPLANCTEFSMANANNSRNLGGDGTKTYPYKVAIDLERTTARVDFMFTPTLDNAPAGVPDDQSLLGYKVVNRNNESTQEGWMYISHIKLMNVAQYTPYTLKRLANDESTCYYLKEEEHNNDDEAEMYVIEPNTWNKRPGGATYNILYGDTHISHIASSNNIPSLLSASESVHAYSTPQTHPNTNDGFNAGWSKDRISGESYYVLDYINENTVEKEHTDGRNTTSLLLVTKFVPKDMYYISEGELLTKAAQYGQTFWMMEKLEGGARTKLYFMSPEAAELYKTKNPSATYGAQIKYQDGTNYYTIWIRHDNNGNDALIGKMEYAIVRNNIYRIGVNKVVGPGNPQPVATENPEDINTRIYVRKWNVIDIPTINI